MRNEVLTFGFTIGTLFDMKDSEEVYNSAAEHEKEAKYREYFENLNKTRSVFRPGPALALYMGLNQQLKRKIPSDLIKFRFGISSRFDTIHPGTKTLFNSLKHYFLMSVDEDITPDYVSLTSGQEQASSHKMQGADVVFTSSESAAKEYYEAGVSSVYIPNLNSKQNNEMFKNKNSKIKFIFDFDGVVADHSSEIVFQATKRIEGLKPINEFRKHEIENIELPLPLGPLGILAKKLSIIVEYYHSKMLKGEIKMSDIPFKSQLLTARSGAAIFRVQKTLLENNIKLNKADFADGREKHIALGMLNHDEINLFLEDSIFHVQGTIEKNPHVLAGLVFNDYTTGKETLDNAEKKLRAKNKINQSK